MKLKILIFPLCIWLIAGLCCISANGQAPPVRSFTGQFTARKLQPTAFVPVSVKTTPSPLVDSRIYLLSTKGTSTLGNNDEVTLEPTTLVVSCERLKDLLLSRLGLADRWQGWIDLAINADLPEDKGPQLAAFNYPQGWTYRLELPAHAKEEILIRALIQTLLLEMANRQAGVQSAEIPLWLVEGISADLQANNLPTFIVQPGQNWTRELKWDKTRQKVPLVLRQRAALTFQQLSWPQESDLTAEGLPLYRSCAQLFVEQLLRFDDGRTSLCSMIAQLPLRWNWQTAFLQAFHSHFQQFLDVEKWWSVNCVDFVIGSKAQTWSAADCRKQLQSSLDVPVDVHFGADQMPVEARITLQEVIRQWSPLDSYKAIQRAVGELKFLVPRSSPEVRPLAQLYLKTLLDYLNASQAASRDRQLGKNPPSLLPFVKTDAIRQLDALDKQREALWHSAVTTNLTQK